jgi:phage shock protein PspC (stress-responsive transcriptional regulator)
MICTYCRSDIPNGARRCPACTTWLRESQREWERPREGRMIAGVCRGLADRFALPVAVLRFLFLISLLLGGGGFVIYVALWIAMPNAAALPSKTPPASLPEPAASGTPST